MKNRILLKKNQLKCLFKHKLFGFKKILFIYNIENVYSELIHRKSTEKSDSKKTSTLCDKYIYPYISRDIGTYQYMNV